MEEKRLMRQQVFSGKIIDVYSDTVQLPNGKEASREVVEHGGAVAVLAVDQQQQVILVKQYRYPIQQLSLEVPAGKLERGEDPLESAKRELKEETGFEAKVWKPIFRYYTSPGFANEVIYLYLATELTYTGQCPDEDEFVEVESCSLEQAWTKIQAGEIEDGKTIQAILWGKLQLSMMNSII